jgi:hypothetical protein
MVNRDKLAVIRQLLTEVQGDLDQTATPCGHCGLSKKENFPEFKIAQEIGGILTKVDRWINTVPAKSGQEVTS